ncbi:MAG: SPOR domain-containing protein, partial [Gammaproteobacteria bacterium]|nr:SPOR domain-containing protein [Gammaproteobacteria bacterium]
AGARPAGDGRRALAIATGDGSGRLLLSDSLSVGRSAPSAASGPAGGSERGRASIAPGEVPAPREPPPAPAQTQAAVSPSSASASAPAAGNPVADTGDVERLTDRDIGPLTRARLAATQEWLRDADGAHFSIQLLLTDFAQRADLERFLRERQLAGEIADYYVYETRIRSRTWYGVLYREYATFGAAKAALEGLPEVFRRHRPFIRNVRDIASMHETPPAAASSDPRSPGERATGT